jgi:hypothetical protein
MFQNLDYKKWCIENRLAELLNVDLEKYGTVTKKIYQGTADPKNTAPYVPELDDLTRLHHLIRTRKVTTILEFGVGKSTLVFADALKKNKEEFGEFVEKNLRRANAFEIHSLDNITKWVETCKKDFKKELKKFVTFSVSPVEMTTFGGRACTMYKKIPNIAPDFIYLDGPDQWPVSGNVRGITTQSKDRLPMAADILMLEPFLLPGTLIVVDGRTANARFIKNNLQRNWEYTHYPNEDIHTFELMEAPLGKYNAAQIRFCLGEKAPQLTQK